MHNEILSFKEKIQQICSFMRLHPFDISTAEGRSNERYRRIALTTLFSLVNKCVTFLTGLISIPLTIHYLGAERYGLWMTISSAISFLTFADLGLGNGLVNAISKSDGMDNQDEATTSVASVFFLLLGISSTLFLFYWIVYSHIPWYRFFNVVSDTAIRESGPTMTVLVSICLINMPLGIIERIRLGYQEGYKNQIWLSVGSIIGLLAVLLAIRFEAGLPWLVLAISSGSVLATFMNGFQLFVFSKPKLFPNLKRFNYHISKNLIGIGFIFFILQLFAFLGNSIDNIIIAHTLGASAVASYAVTKKLFMVLQISQFIILPLWPAFGEALARQNYVWAKKALVSVLKFTLVIGILIALPLLMLGKPIISLWIGRDFIPSTSLLISFFFWVILVNYGGTMSSFLNNGSLLGKQCIFFGAGAISSLVFQVVFIHFLGVSGVIWGMVIGYGIFYAIPAYRLAFDTLDNHINYKGLSTNGCKTR